MYKGPAEAAEFCLRLREQDLTGVEVVVCPSYVSLAVSVQLLAGTEVAVAAQNVHWEDEGAFTGEVSTTILLELGVQRPAVGADLALVVGDAALEGHAAGVVADPADLGDLVGAEPDRLPAGRLVEQRQRAPVPGQPAGVRRQEHDVRRDAARQEVLAVLHRVAGLAGRDDDQRRCPVKLSRRPGLGRVGGCLQPLERLRADDPEPPRVRQVVVRRPPGEVEQLVERPGVDGLGAVRLVRPAAANRGVDIHHREAARPSSAEGFSSDERSPGSSPSAAARTARRPLVATSPRE